jgi:hypothetical protein
MAGPGALRPATEWLLQPIPTPSIGAPQSGQTPFRMRLTRTWNP